MKEKLDRKSFKHVSQPYCFEVYMWTLLFSFFSVTWHIDKDVCH